MHFKKQVRANVETPQSKSQPDMAERAADSAADGSRTIAEVSAALQAAVERLSLAIETARQPGKPLATISAITREAPLTSLLVAFLFGVAVMRRR
jgi:basic membrane lipoprotein Med (substrate-binding protein (PBP1-ABC) superfamily)